MTNLQSIKEKIEMAYDFKTAATGTYRKWQDGYRAEVKKISDNRNLTDVGKLKLKESLSERKTVELMQLSKKQQAEYRAILDAAYLEASKIANSKPATVDPVKADRFDRSFGEVRTSILLANPDKAIKILREFIDATEEPALVDRIRSEFAAVVAPVIAQANQVQKDSLTDMFQQTRIKAKGAEVIEAEQLMETSKAMSDSKFFGLHVIESVKEVHPEAQKYLNNPAAFFEEYPGTESMNTSLRSQEEVMLEAESEII